MKKLYTPVKINQLELKNRLVMSPMSIGHTVEGFITDDVVELYKRRAQGGVGLIIFANMQWDKVRYNPNHGAMLTDEKFIPMLKKLTDGIHIFYLNIQEIYEDENHNLAQELTFDDVHLYAQHYDKWVKYLKTHAVVRGE